MEETNPALMALQMEFEGVRDELLLATQQVASIVPGESNPVSLRNSINEVDIRVTAIVELLVAKGVFTELEYWQKLLDTAKFHRDIELERWWNLQDVEGE